jgi:L-iditol 2-dehydrogenase
MDWVQDRELEIVGSLMYVRDDFLTVIELIRTGQIITAPLIANRAPLGRIVEVYVTLDHTPGAGIKTLIDVARPGNDDRHTSEGTG